MSNSIYILDFSKHSPAEVLLVFQHHTGLEKDCPGILNFLADWENPETNTFTFHTSGSTGEPQSIRFSKAQLIASAQRSIETFQLKKGSHALLCLPFQFVAGKMMLVRAMLAKQTLIITKAVANPLKNIPEHTVIHFAAFVPYQLDHILKDKSSLKKFNSTETVIIGGGAVSPSLLSKLSEIKTRVYHTYGMTETLTHIAIKQLSPQHENHFNALPGVAIRTDEQDCLIIEDKMLNLHSLKTRDIVQILSEDKFEWLGRLDHVVNSGGVKLYPEKIEEKIARHIPSPFFLAGIPDETLGQKLVLFIETGGKPDWLTTFSEKISTILQKYEQPKAAYLCDAFINTQSGKLKRNETAQQVLNQSIASVEVGL